METPVSPSSLPDFDALWNYGDPAATEARFRELLPAARASGDRSYLAQLLTQIARTEGLQQQFDRAHRTLDEVSEMMEDQPAIPYVRYLLERGRVFNSSDDPQSALPLFIEAWEKAGEAGADNYAIDAAHMVAIVAPEQALEWNEQALALAESSDDKRARRWLGSLYNNIGWTYHARSEYTKALENFEKYLAWNTERDTGEGEFTARWTVARAMRSLGRVEESLSRQQVLLKDRETAGAMSDGYVHEEIGECLLALGRRSEAAPSFATAYDLLSQDIWLAANEKSRLARLKKLGTVGTSDAES